MILVTGGAGFIGSHLVRALLSEGRRVRVVDDFSTGRREAVPPGVELLEGDVNDLAARAVEGAERVFHLAAMSSVPASLERPLESHRSTASGTLALLEAAARAGARRVVVASSSSVYGDAPPRTFPSSPYGAAKLAAEFYARGAARLRGLETVALRFFNVYGPGQDARSAVVPAFLQSLLAGRPMPLFGDGLQTRDFIYVDDAVRALLLAAEARAASGAAYDIGSGHAASLRDLGAALAALLNRPPDFEVRPPRAGDVRATLADVDPARRDLGFEAAVPLAEGLRRTAAAARA